MDDAHDNVAVSDDQIKIDKLVYRLKFKDGSSPVLHPGTFCPMKKLNIELDVAYERQHDGPEWTSSEYYLAESELLSMISYQFNRVVSQFIYRVNPFGRLTEVQDERAE